MTAQDEDVSPGQRRAAVRKARGHWLLALSELEGPRQRPGVVLIGGLPGTGKTTLAQDLANELGFRLVSSDRVRKELAGIDSRSSGRRRVRRGDLHGTSGTIERTPRVMDAAEALVFEGERVIVDASFREAKRRRAFLEAAGIVGCSVAAPHVRGEPGARTRAPIASKGGTRPMPTGASTRRPHGRGKRAAHPIPAGCKRSRRAAGARRRSRSRFGT
jgi:predicted kinase